MFGTRVEDVVGTDVGGWLVGDRLGNALGRDKGGCGGVGTGVYVVDSVGWVGSESPMILHIGVSHLSKVWLSGRSSIHTYIHTYIHM